MIYSEEFERGILGSILIEPSVTLELCSEKGITVDSFYLPAHRLLYAHFCQAYTEGSAIDLITTYNALKDSNELEKMGGYIFLESLIDGTPTSAHAEFYIDGVMEKKALRNVSKLCRQIKDEAEGDGAKADVIVSDLQSKALSLTSTQSTELSLEEHGEEFLAKCESGTAGHLPHFCSEWTNELGRLSNEIVFLHAPRSTGKTALAIQWQRVLHKTGMNVPFLSLESLKESIVPRYIAQEAQVNTLNMKRGNTPPYSSKYAEAREALKRLKEMNLTVRDGSMTIEQIMAFAKLHKNAGADGIIIDNLLCIGSNKEFESRTKMYIYFLEHIRKIRNAVNIPIIILAHPNEDGKIAWARDVENLADVIMYLYSVEEMRQKNPKAFEASGITDRWLGEGHAHICCKIQKNRDGELPRLQLDFDKEHQTFHPIVDQV